MFFRLLSAVLPEAVRPALARNVTVTATLARDAAGALRIDPLSVQSGAFDASGTVAYGPEPLDVQLEGGFADLQAVAGYFRRDRL